MLIRKANFSEANFIAKIHAQSITSGFLSSLPIKFLTRLYNAIAKNSCSTVLVAVSEQGDVCGFVAGTTSVNLMYKFVIARDGIFLLMCLLPKLFSFNILKQLYETFYYGIKFKREKNVKNKISAELLSIAIDKSNRGVGTGKELVDALESFFLKNGVKRYKVVTFSEDMNSNAFYMKCEFQLHTQFLHHGNLMNEYVKELKWATLSG